MSLPRRPIRTLTALAITGLLLSSLVSSAMAKTPLYTSSVFATPNPVSYGGQVRFDVTWTNTSGANLPTVFVKAGLPLNSTFIGEIGLPSQGTCDTSDPKVFSCAFGTVNNGASVSFSVVYQVPSSGPTPFSVNYVFTAQGNTTNDTPGKSRGDDMPVTASVSLTSDQESGGSYIFDTGLTAQNNQILNKKNNVQSAKMTFTLAAGSDGFGASVREIAAGSADAATCPATLTTCFGNWNSLSVNGGQDVPGGFTLLLGYVSVPGNGSTVHFVHVSSPTVFKAITDACTYTDGSTTPNNIPCIAGITSSGGNTYYTLWLGHNGQVRAF
jgi:hypothetical protein